MKLRKAAKKAGHRPVLIHWIDSTMTSEWVKIDEESVPILDVYSIGWLIEKTKTALTVSSSATQGPPRQANAPLSIPRCAVIFWRYLDKKR